MNLLRRFENHVWHPFATDRHPLWGCYTTSHLVSSHLSLPHHRLLQHGIAYQPDAGVCGVAVDAGIMFCFRIPLNPIRGSLSVADGIPGRALFCFRIPLNPVRGSLSVADGIPGRAHNPVWGCTSRVFYAVKYGCFKTK